MTIKSNITAQFSIQYTTFLNTNGKLTQELPDCVTDPNRLVAMYKTMVLTRMFDAKAIALQRTGRIGTFPSALGQEAIGVAIGTILRADDVFCPYYRDYGAHLLRGIAMEEIFAFWGGDERGSCFANNKEDFPHAIPIGSQVLHAAGVATAMKLRKQKRCTVTTLGDGGTSEGDFYEAMNLAGIWYLPIVFVINNNQWAISVPRNLQTGTKTLAQKGIAAGIHSEQVDGNDIIALCSSLNKAAQRARDGKGATLIEAITYRLGDHTTADDAKRYRTEQEVTDARQNEPIKRLAIYLREQSLWDDKQEERLNASCHEQIENAVQRYVDMVPQKRDSMFEYLYATLPAALEEQRQDLLDHIAK